nr:nucleoside-diphosphate sugar epimerase/dehydratase [Georgfuchsia toluolica]
MTRTLFWVVGIQTIVFLAFGLYRGIWRFASIPDLRRIGLAAATSALAAPTVLFMLDRMEDVPRSVLVLDPILLLLIMGGSRFFYRAWKDGHLFSLQQLGATPVIILGAGAAAAALLRDLASDSRWRVVGLLDDDPAKAGLRLQGVTVLGPLAELSRHAKRLAVENAIVAMPSRTVGERRRAMEIAVEAGVSALTVPSMADVLSGKTAVSQIRNVELEDLLGRDQVQLDDAGLRGLLTGRVVMVTGAGGSIGSELCRQIAAFSPAKLVFYEASEFALYSIEQEFVQHFPRLAIVAVAGDVKDAATLEQAFSIHRPKVIFHAAAYKHVPLMEADNAWAAVRNNVFGTACVARAAIRHEVERFVLISTDKAVNPTNVMGASKRLAELACRALQEQSPLTCFVSVRFGNVLGSSGSVIPKFREQIEKGGPVTVTHPDIVRYFMLIPEAAQLVLQAGLMGKGGEIFVLDMGEPVKIADLARDMIRLSGFSEDEICIEFTGLRPGEKLFEELLADSETTLPTLNPKLRIACANETHEAEWLATLDTWLAVPVKPADEVKQELKQWVPEYMVSTRPAIL